MLLILLCHGDTEGAAGLNPGRSERPLSAVGFTQMQNLAALWDTAPPRFLFSSDRKAAQQSANVFAARFAIEPLLDARLRDAELGEWDNRQWDDIAENDSERFAAWTDDWVHTPTPGGESFDDVLRRTGLWLDGLADQTRVDDKVLAVTHAGTIRALLCHTLNLAPEQAHAVCADPARVSAIRYRPGRFEVCYANASHFEIV